jgi:hypothetical protein
MRNTVVKKAVRQENVDSDYLFVSRLQLVPFVQIKGFGEHPGIDVTARL